jgi:hypothetical protein
LLLDFSDISKSAQWRWLVSAISKNQKSSVSGVLMMEAARTSETLVNFYQTTQRYNPEDSYLRTHRRENLKSYFGNNSLFPFSPKLYPKFL